MASSAGNRLLRGREKAKGPLSSGPASEALGGESRGRLGGPAGTESQDWYGGNSTTRKVDETAVASVVVGIDAGDRGKLAGGLKKNSRSQELV